VILAAAAAAGDDIFYCQTMKQGRSLNWRSCICFYTSTVLRVIISLVPDESNLL